MTIYDKFINSSKEALAEWLDEHGMFDDSPWMKWFDNNYCQKCESEIIKRADSKLKLGFELKYVSQTECSYCEVYKHCRFFPDKKEVPSNKEIIEMWLSLEVKDG